MVEIGENRLVLRRIRGVRFGIDSGRGVMSGDASDCDKQLQACVVYDFVSRYDAPVAAMPVNSPT